MVFGTVYSVIGPCELSFEKGRFNVNGSTYVTGSHLTVQEGKSIIVQPSSTDCQLTWETGLSGVVNEIRNPLYFESYDRLLAAIIENDLKRIIIIGEMDTGKTYLSLYLANKLLNYRQCIGIIDCDLGQSDIGPPACLGSSLFEHAVLDMKDTSVYEIHFIGSLTPEGNLTNVLMGMYTLAKNLTAKTETIIVDTCGWTRGDGARLLKSAQMTLFEPDCVVLLQRNKELEHLVHYLPQEKVFRIHVQSGPRKISQKERKHNREKKSRCYFSGASRFGLPFEAFQTMGSYFKTGREVSEMWDLPIIYGEEYGEHEGNLCVLSPVDLVAGQSYSNKENVYCRFIIPGAEKGLLIGLLDRHQRTLGLGIVEKIDFKNRILSLVSPLDRISDVSIISFGSLRYNYDGSEIGFATPGHF